MLFHCFSLFVICWYSKVWMSFFVQRLVVCLEESIYIHNIKDMKLLKTLLNTSSNPSGITIVIFINIMYCWKYSMLICNLPMCFPRFVCSLHQPFQLFPGIPRQWHHRRNYCLRRQQPGKNTRKAIFLLLSWQFWVTCWTWDSYHLHCLTKLIFLFVVLLTQSTVTMIPAHDSPLAAITFNASGTKLASASERVNVSCVYRNIDV